MKEGVEIFIRPHDLEMRASFKKETEAVALPVSDFGVCLTRFCAPKNPAGLRATFYLSEDLLFFKKFALPLKTADIREAVGYQLTMLAPFEGRVLHGYTASRGKQEYTVCLYVLPEEKALPWLEAAAAQGFHLNGLFPESQRYVTRHGRKRNWSLLLPGRFPRLFLFSDAAIRDRILCHDLPSADQLSKLDPGEVIYSPEPPPESVFQDCAPLLAEPPLNKEFNLLPVSFRRPDYLRYALVSLCLLNLIALVAVGVIKEHSLLSQLRMVEEEIAVLEPQIKEVEKLRLQESSLNEAIQRIEGIGQNFDMIDFFDKVTQALPKNSYLDQVRMDEKTGAIQLQGYTDDIAELTSQLDALNQAKLKSTSRRKNQTYFHVEVGGK